MIEYETILKENEVLLELIKNQWILLTPTDRFELLNSLKDLQLEVKSKNQIKPYKYKPRLNSWKKK
jgi:hypothetical protein